jgi:hypothetical protein
MSKPKPRKPLTAKQIQDDIDFYNHLKSLPPEKLAFLDPGMDVITALFEEALAAREEERIAREAAEAAKKAVHDSHIAVCEARIADLLANHPRNPFDNDLSLEGDDNDAGNPPTLH